MSAQCLSPLLGSLPSCQQHLWVNTGKGWSCVPPAPANPPMCHPPFLFPMLVNGSWQCLGGPGPVILPMPPHTMPMQPAPMPPATPMQPAPADQPGTPDVVVAHRT